MEQYYTDEHIRQYGYDYVRDGVYVNAKTFHAGFFHNSKTANKDTNYQHYSNKSSNGECTNRSKLYTKRIQIFDVPATEIAIVVRM